MEQFELKMDRGEQRIWSISDLTHRIKETLESFIGSCSIKGEIANFRKQSSGHLYFSLRDQNSQITAVMFRNYARSLEFEPKNGMEIILEGDLTVYEPRGNYQLIARSIRVVGQGSLQEQLDVLKKKLFAEGIFDLKREQNLPKQIENIGVITSPTGAALQDFLRIAKRRNFSGKVWLYPSKVQGKESAKELMQQLDLAVRHQKVEVLVLTRGGGSLEDLWGFNQESLVRAVANCSIPIISAVGHQIDFSLCDFAADLRMETPSGAAEWITSQQVAQRKKIVEWTATLHRGITHSIAQQKERLNDQYRTWERNSPVKKINQYAQNIDDFEWRLQKQIKNAIAQHTTKRDQSKSSLQHFSPTNILDAKKLRLQQNAKSLFKIQKHALEIVKLRYYSQKTRLQNGSLQRTLRRGFCYVRTSEDGVITKANQIRERVNYQLVLQDGQKLFKIQEDQN